VEAGTVLKDRYRVERRLGRGGMASVWLAEDTVLERPVAVKVLSDTIASDPGFSARFRREAHLAASLSHPNLIGIYDYAEAAEQPYLVMEYVAGPNLAERMAQGVEVDCERLARELLGALAHIHAAGIVHRDVKPQNVLLGPDGSAKLIDFGIALPADAAALTQTGQVLGTARYVAPEVMRGEPAGERSDLFACGVLLRECLGPNSPTRLRVLADRLANADPRGRPASAEAVVARLNRGDDAPEQATQAMPLEPPTRAPTTVAGGRPRRRSRATGLTAALAGLAAAAVGLAVAFGGASGGGGEPERNAAAGREAASPAAPAVNEKPEEAQEAPSQTTKEDVPEETTPAVEAAASGSALNQQGYELIQAGRPEEAVPLLEEAVAALPADGEDLEYAYALFNLGNALRLSGRAAEAIPVLEERLLIPNQTGVVRRELEAAESEVG
jgi:eukaryotic-like serine/threonine-protein kinase